MAPTTPSHSVHPNKVFYPGDPSGAPQSSVVNDNMGGRDISEITLGPQNAIVETGNQLVLVAGVKDLAGRYRANEPVQWTIEPGSQGTFIEVPTRTWTDIILGDYTRPEIRNAQKAITSTLRNSTTLTKGTPAVNDDTFIDRGHTWTVISAAAEGTTRVSAVALNSGDWNKKSRCTSIHWIDARVSLPPRIMANSIGQPLILSTGVVRRNGSPAVGCLVTYKIAAPNSDGFKTEKGLVQEISVPVNEKGVANVVLVRESTETGLSQVSISVCRTTCDGRFTQPINIAQSVVQCRWGGGGIRISKTGPLLARVGEKLKYRIIVQNTGEQGTGPLLITDEFPESFRYVKSIPPGTEAPPQADPNNNVRGIVNSRLQWRMENLPPGRTMTVETVYQSQTAGVFIPRAYASAGCLYAEDRTRTQISPKLYRDKEYDPEGNNRLMNEPPSNSFLGDPSGFTEGAPAPTATPNPGFSEGSPDSETEIGPAPASDLRNAYDSDTTPGDSSLAGLATPDSSVPGSLSARDSKSGMGSGTTNPSFAPAPLPPPPSSAAAWRTPSKLDVHLESATRVNLNNNLYCQILIINKGENPVANARITVYPTSGLQSCNGSGSFFTNTVGIILPGQMRVVGMQFRAIQPGEQKISLVLLTEDMKKYTRTALIQVLGDGYTPNVSPLNENNGYSQNPAESDAAAPDNYSSGPELPPANTSPNAPNPNNASSPNASPTNVWTDPYAGKAPQTGQVPPSELPLPAVSAKDLDVQVACESKNESGKDFTISILLINRTGQSLHNVQITNFLDPNLKVVQYTEGFRREPGAEPYWLLEEVLPDQQYGLMLKLHPETTNFMAENRITVRAQEGHWAERVGQIQIGDASAPARDPLAGTSLPPLDSAPSNLPEETSSLPLPQPLPPGETPSLPENSVNNTLDNTLDNKLNNTQNQAAETSQNPTDSRRQTPLPDTPGIPESKPSDHGTADLAIGDQPGLPLSSDASPSSDIPGSPLTNEKFADNPDNNKPLAEGESNLPELISETPETSAAPAANTANIPNKLPTEPSTAESANESANDSDLNAAPESNANQSSAPVLLDNSNTPETGTVMDPVLPLATEALSDANAAPNSAEEKPEGNFPDKLVVSLTSHRVKWIINQPFTSTISIKNDTGDTVSDITIVFIYPDDAFQPVRVGTKGPSEYTIENPNGSGLVTFRPISSLENGKSLNYDIRLIPTKTGATEIMAEIRAKEKGITNIQTRRKLTIQTQ